MEWVESIFNFDTSDKYSEEKNTAKLYGDALLYTAVFIDWLDLFELVH